MQYRTLSDLSNLVRNNIHKIPHDVDLVVGIPRSGMLPANMIALFLNKKLTDVDSFVEGRIFRSGERSKYIEDSEIKKVLIVDDSVCSGNAIAKAKKKLTPLLQKYEFVFLAPIVTAGGTELVDVFFEIIDEPRIFEWNLFHHAFIENACLDIDGVLNVDPEIDDDGSIYEKFLHDATPMFLPTVKVDTLISCRLEKYRKETEEWLNKYGVRYNRLVLLDMPSKSARVAWGKHGEYKGQYYMKHDNILFVESSKKQAEIIARMTNKPVVCLETNQMLQYAQQPTLLKRLKKKLRKRCPKLYNMLRLAR